MLPSDLHPAEHWKLRTRTLSVGKLPLLMGIINVTLDSVLSGRIVGETKQVVVPSLSGDPREIQVGTRVEVSWIDHKGRTLRPVESIPCPAEITDVSGTGNLVPEVGQSVATAQQQAICRMAQQIVGLMEKPW